MSQHLVDISLHIDELLFGEPKAKIVETVKSLDGVVSACFSQSTPHLMHVEYDSEEVAATSILNSVKARGVHAELVGM